MWRRHAHDLPVPKGRARSRPLLFIVALLGVLMTQASGAQEAAPAASAGAGAEPIDTRITVQPSRATKPVQEISGTKTKSGIGAQLPAQQASRQPGDSTTPNAVGFPVVRRGAPQAGPPGVLPPPVTQPATAPANPNAPANAGLVGGGSKFGHPAVMNRAAISGTGMTHPGSGLGMVQGMPKSLGTVSGTNLQPKR
jgi:hypothetical protein